MAMHELYFKLLNFVEKSDEQGAKDFVISNLNEFPKKIKEDLAFQFFVEATVKENGRFLRILKDEILVNFKKEIFDTLN